FFSSRRRHTRFSRDWSSDVCSSDLTPTAMSDAERLSRAAAFADELSRRRTVRDYAPTPVPREVIEHCLRAAGTAPSGANQQPWQIGRASCRERVEISGCAWSAKKEV